MPVSEIIIRVIQPADNAPLATIVRAALTEFGANKPGTVYYDLPPMPCTSFSVHRAASIL
jgi:hypothetical protein